MANGFLVNNLLPFYSAITGSGIATGYEYKSAVDEVPSNYIMGAGSSLTVNVDLGIYYQNSSFDSFAVFYLDVDFVSVVVKLSNVSYGGAGESFTITSSAAFSRTFWQKSPDSNQLFEQANESLYYYFGATKQYRYIQFVFTSFTGFCRVGTLFLGTKITMDKEPKSIYPIYKSYQTTVNVDGNRLVSQDSEQEGFRLSYQLLDYTNREAQKWAVRGGVKVYVPNFASNDCYLGHVLENKIETPLMYDKYNELHVTFMEQGITEQI